MTVDDPGDGENAGNSAAERHRFHGTDSGTDAGIDSDSGTGIETAKADAAEADATEAAAEDRDREECYDDLRTGDPAARRTAELKSPGESRCADDGRWQWKGLELGGPANRVADEQLAARREAEGRDEEGGYGERGITPAMRRIEAGLEHGTLVPDTEKFALKSPDRFKEKLAKMITLEPDVMPGDLAERIHDGIRYTFLFEDEYYSAGVKEAESKLTGAGYNLVWRKPSWSGEEYKGINSQWHDGGSGQLFEVQFHTQASWDAKQRTHDSYEKIENPATPAEERIRLRAYQREVSASVPVPPGALDFAIYRKEGDR